jgi:antitoxin component YwqK of YwqJK toxin-antitoxin module
MQDKYQHNEQGKRHGYWEKYRTNKTLWYKCNYINGVWYGYFEHHRFPRIAKEYAAR